jgi:hypothetical protein
MKILNRLPIPTTDTLTFIGAESVRIKEAEIIVWVSLTVTKSEERHPATPCFPVILDTGHTHNFAIQEQHLLRWAGMRPEMLRSLGHVRHAGQRIPLYGVDLWLHHNKPGQMTVASKQLLLDLPRGIAVYPNSANYPRLPLLGLRALLGNNLHVAIDGEHKTVNLRTRDWRTRLLRWLG